VERRQGVETERSELLAINDIAATLERVERGLVEVQNIVGRLPSVWDYEHQVVRMAALAAALVLQAHRADTPEAYASISVDMAETIATHVQRNLYKMAPPSRSTEMEVVNA
jgi:hypothetical protein